MLTPPTNVSGKDKEVSYDDPSTSQPMPPPPLGFLNEKQVTTTSESETSDDWMRFEEVGFLDMASMEEKDRQALLDKNTSLEQKLYDYRYNMGLLLIDYKESNAKVKELSEAVSEGEEVIRLNEADHLITVSEAEKREENLRNMLDLEKGCRVDLEKAVFEIGEENEKIKFSFETMLADANNLLAGIDDKSIEVNKKMQEADAKLTAANAKFMELERRFEEIETRERMVQRERLSFNEERKGWEVKLSKQNEDLREWERTLHEEKERLCVGRRIINQREEKVNEMEMTLKHKEKELEDVQTNIDLSSLEAKRKDDDLNNRLAKLIQKELEVELIQGNLEMKEKELLDWAEKLDEKERVEIQNLLDAHKEALNSKRLEFDLELEEKRKSIEEDMRRKVDVVEKKETEINHQEEKLRKQEQAFEKKTERFNEKENHLDTKLKALKEKEKSVNADTKKVELDQKQILADKEIIQVLKEDIEKVKAEILEKELKLNENVEKLKITEDERTRHARLQSTLKEEINSCRVQRELFEKEVEDLKNDRMKFEEEWRALDVKRTEISNEQRELDEQKERLEKLHKSEEARLEKEKGYTKDYVKRKLEVLENERESFVATMNQGLSLLAENAEKEQKRLLHEFELKNRDLETVLEEKRVELEKQYQVKNKAFEDEREKEFSTINYLKEVTKKETEELEHERRRIDKEKEEISINMKQLQEKQLEMHNDVNVLSVLSEKIKNQREEFANERSHFLAFVDKLKSCAKCGELTGDFELSDLQILEGSGDSPLSRTGDEITEKSEDNIIIATEKNTSHNSGGFVSRFKKRVAKFKLSPHQNNVIENVPAQLSETVNESQQPELRSGSRKRSPDRTCLGSETDMVVADSEVGSESVTKGGRKKRRGTTAARLNMTGDADTVGGVDALLVKNSEIGGDFNGANEYSGDNSDEESDNDVQEKQPGEESLGKKLWNFFST